MPIHLGYRLGRESLIELLLTLKVIDFKCPQHSLLGILQEGETGGGMAMRVLRECGVDCQKLEQQFNSV